MLISCVYNYFRITAKEDTASKGFYYMHINSEQLRIPAASIV